MPSYLSIFGWQVPFTKPKSDKTAWTGTDVLKNVFGYGDQEYTNTKGDVVTRPGRSPVTDVLSVLAYYRAKKDKEGLNEHEMKIYNDLLGQTAGHEAEFDLSTAGGAELTAPLYSSNLSDVAAPKTIDFSGNTTPDLTLSAEGGRIGYADGLTVAEKGPLYVDSDTDLPLHNIEKKFQRMSKEERLNAYFDMLKRIESYKELVEVGARPYKEFLHWGPLGGDEIDGGGSGHTEMTEALEYTDHPAAEALYERGEHYNRGGRIGYDNGGIGQLMPRRGRVMYPGGYAGEKFDLANLDSLKGLRDPFVPGRLDREGEGFYQDDLTGVRDPFKTSPEMIEIQKDYDIERMRDPFKLSEIQKLVQEIMKLYEDIEVKDAIKLAEDIIKHNQIQVPGNAQGGRIGYGIGSLPINSQPQGEESIKMAGTDTPPIEMENLQELLSAFYEAFGRYPTSIDELKGWARNKTQAPQEEVIRGMAAYGGRIGYAGGNQVLPLLDLGGQEKDYREDGGFVPIGRKEKADDVPARLSKNEFVFTADAVRAAGGGDIDEGAQRMYNVMKNLEAGGEISQETQGKI